MLSESSKVTLQVASQAQEMGTGPGPLALCFPSHARRTRTIFRETTLKAQYESRELGAEGGITGYLYMVAVGAYFP